MPQAEKSRTQPRTQGLTSATPLPRPHHEVVPHLCERLREVLKCQTLLLTWRMSVSVRISDFPIISGNGSSIEHTLQELKNQIARILL